MYQGHVLDKEPIDFFLSSSIREVFFLWCHMKISQHRNAGDCTSQACIPPYKKVLASHHNGCMITLSPELDLLLSWFMAELLWNLSYPYLLEL